jgi:hypothetical protein
VSPRNWKFCAVANSPGRSTFVEEKNSKSYLKNGFWKIGISTYFRRIREFELRFSERVVERIHLWGTER